MSQNCPTCGNDRFKPYRVYDQGDIAAYGCVDEFHNGAFQFGSRDAEWHNRPAAQAIRGKLAALRDTARIGRG